jgi:hypothetical protein
LEDFSLLAGSDGLRVQLKEVWGFPDKTSYAGGYDTLSTIEIWSGCYRANGTLYISTGEIYSFYEKLQTAFKLLSGSATLKTLEGQLELTLSFEDWGHFRVKGRYREKLNTETELFFEMSADQTYLEQTLTGLQKIYETFGDNSGK